MKKTFSNWKSAHSAAVELANQCNREVGLEKKKEFGKICFGIFLLPNPENRQAHELTCEVVRPGDPD